LLYPEVLLLIPVLEKEDKGCALLCHCRRHLEADDDQALLGVIRDHLIQEHPAIVPTDAWVMQVVATRSYYLEHTPVRVGGTVFEEEEEFGPEPY
jgi:hypothetical protein